MKERQILFSGPMVRAILDGQKTQTRRIIKPQPVYFGNGWQWKDEMASFVGSPLMIICEGSAPYGLPGDRLWVRETWTDLGNISVGAAMARPGKQIFYAADGHMLDRGGRWKPSIHMPRKYCRIILEIKGIRVERIRSISDADAIAEGFASKDEFIDLFFNVNKRAQMDSDPFVWVIEFERIK